MKQSWLRRLIGKAGRGTSGSSRPRFQPRLEVLENRSVPAGLVVTDSLTPAALVANLLGPGVTASNITYKGNAVSSGTFTGGTGIIGFESGLILSSGKAKSVVGPNDNADSASTNNGLPGDAQLDTLIPPPGSQSHDATVLSFDFVPKAATLTFNFVFGSEEYGQFVGAGFNDVFGFFLNGKNVAVLPGTSTAVGVGTVNAGNPSNNTPASNPQFFINNSPASDPVPAPNAVNTQLDGLTVVIPVTTAVNAGVVNHISLGVEDVQDGILDSDVFIQSGSFSANPPAALSAATPNFIAYRPLRYAFRSLEQNTGNSGPTPLGGTATTPTFDGNVTVLNFGAASFIGTLNVEFANLPPGVQVVNATGVDPKTNLPFITVSNVALLAGGANALRVPIKIVDTSNVSPGTFFEGPLFVDVFAAGT